MPDPIHFPIGTGAERPPVFAELRATDPLTPMIMPSGDEVLVSLTYPDVRAILTDARFSRDLSFPGAPRFVPGADMSELSDMLSNMDPPRHTRLRRIVAAAFMPRQIATWRPRLTEITEELAEEISAKGPPADLVEGFTLPLPLRIICELLGVPHEDRELFKGWIESFFSSSPESSEARGKSTVEFAAYVAGLLANRRAHPGDALIDALLEAHDEGDRLSEDELLSMVVGLVAAGLETTASVLARGLLSLLSQPGAYAALVADPEKIPAAVEEILRYHTPGEFGLFRVATEDVELPSGTVRKGQVVMPPTGIANRDPAVFADPDRFDIDRPPCPHLGFGHGAHFCLGAHLARQEMQVGLETLVRRFPGLRLAADPGTLPWTSGAIIRRPLSVPATW